MEETKENSIVVAGTNELQTNLFGGEQTVKKATSLDLTNDDDVDMLLNSMQDVDFKLNDCIDETIVVTGAYATEREVDSFNEETGEVITRKKHTLTLFDENGKSYVTGSNACYMSFTDIVSIKGMPTRENPLKLIPIKVDAKEKGHSYLKLKVAR